METLISLLETLDGGFSHGGKTSLDLFASTGAIKFPVDQTEAWQEKVGADLETFMVLFFFCLVEGVEDGWEGVSIG